MTPKETWNAAYGQLELVLDRASFETWLKAAVFLRYEAGLYIVGVPNEYARDMLQNRLYRNIRKVISDVAGEACELRFEICKDEQPPDLDDPEVPLFKFQQVDEVIKESDTPAEDEAAPDADRLPPEWFLFAKVPHSVVDELDVKILGLLVKLIRHINRKRNILIRSVEQIVQLTGVPKTSLWRYTDALVAAGHLHVTLGGGRGQANTYRLAGMVAVAVCGADVAAATAQEAALGIAPEPAKKVAPDVENQPEMVADAENKVFQNETVSGDDMAANGVNHSKLEQINNKGFHFETDSRSKPFQIETTIKSLKAFKDDLGNKEVDARAGADGDLAEAADGVVVSDKSFSVGGELDDEKTRRPHQTPRYIILHDWTAAFGQPTAYQQIALKDLADRYDAKLIDEALDLVKLQYATDKTINPLKKLQKALNRKHTKLLVLQTAEKLDADVPKQSKVQA